MICTWEEALVQVQMDVVNWEDFLEELGCWEEGRIHLGHSDQGQHSWGFSRQWLALGVCILPLPSLVLSEAISLTSLSLSLLICIKGICVRINM